jgi:LPS sulfotransferase NodH
MNIYSMNIPCWILTTPRTGSTYLCDLLNSTGLFGDHKTSSPVTNKVDRWTEYYCKDFFKPEFLMNPPPINKIHHADFFEYFGHSDLSRILPGVKYVLLKRKDIYAVTVSKYFVLEGAHFMDGKERWNIHTQSDIDKMQRMNLAFNKTRMMNLHQRTKLADAAWDEYLKDKEFLEMQYEDLIHDPTGCVKQVLALMGMEGKPDLNSEKMPMKLDHPQKKLFAERLKKLESRECLLL